MIISILGSGPSLRIYRESTPKSDLVIGCNSMIVEKWFRKIDRLAYVAHEPQLLNSDFIKHLKAFSSDIYLSGILFDQLHKTCPEIPILNLDELLRNNAAADAYLSQFKTEIPTLKNVIIDCCIPLALTHRPDVINLYGCEFNYGNRNQPTYYHGNGTIGRFSHTQKTAHDWSEFSQKRIFEISEVLLSTGTVLNRFID